MPTPREGQERAVLLHVRAFGESDSVFEWFGEHNGRFATLARGRKWRQRCQPCVLYHIEWRGMGELPRLIRSEPDGPVNVFIGEQLYCALYMNELILKLTQRWIVLEGLVPAYLSALEYIRHDALALGLRLFEWRLLDALGYGVGMIDNQGRPIESLTRYLWRPGQGLQPVDGDMGVFGQAILAMHAGHWDKVDVQAVRRLNQARIEYLLAGRTLRTREMLRKYWQEKQKLKEHSHDNN